VEQYDFEVIHRAGSKHGNADGLSRRPAPHQVDLDLVDEEGIIRAVDAEKTAADADSSEHQEAIVASESKNDRHVPSSVGGIPKPSSILCIWQSNSKMILRLVM